MPNERFHANWPVGVHTVPVREIERRIGVPRDFIGLSFARGTDSISFLGPRTSQFRYFNSDYFLTQGANDLERASARARYTDNYLDYSFYSHRDAQATLLFARDFSPDYQSHHAPIAGVIWAVVPVEELNGEDPRLVDSARKIAIASGLSDVENLPFIEIGDVFHRHDASREDKFNADGIDVDLAAKKNRPRGGFEPPEIDPSLPVQDPSRIVLDHTTRAILDTTRTSGAIIIARIGDDNIEAQRLAQQNYMRPTDITMPVQREWFEEVSGLSARRKQFTVHADTITERYYVGILDQNGQMLPMLQS